MNNLSDKIYGSLLEKAVLPIGDLFLNQNIIKRLKFLRDSQYWKKEKLDEERNKLLRNLIITSYNEIPFYKELFNKAKLDPESIKNIDDLYKIPIVTKDMLRKGYPHQTTRKTGFKTHENVTSGSTGKNFVVLEDSPTEGINRAAFILMLEWAGWKIGERHFQTGMTLQRGFLKKMKDIFFRCEYASAFDLRNEVVDRYLSIIENKKIKHIWGYPGSIYYIAKRAYERGLSFGMKSVVTWGDTLEPKARKLIEEVFGKKVNDAYGCAEGIQVACQCSEYGKYHIFSLDTIVEIVDDNGEPLPKGEMGNILLTRLYPGAMPFIRYKVGDRGILGKEKCQCGRSFEILEGLRGREVDEIITPSNNKLIVHFFTGILEHFKEIDEFQVVQKSVNYLVIKVVPRGELNKETEEKIVNAIKEKGASDMDIKIEKVSQIPMTPAGKRKFIIKDFN